MALESSPNEQSPQSLSPDADVASIPPYCALPQREKVLCVVLASLVTILGPLSGNIYLPALDSISRELDASHSTITLTITVFLVFQGIAPIITASVSERHGRRPVVILCLVSYAIVNTCLALQTSMSALFALRCLQSVGGTGVAVVAMAVVADLVTRAERGGYMAYASIGLTLAPALGPVLGGVLTHFLGWRSIFIFLAILAAALALVFLAVMPETCRAVVGNGTTRPQWWNRSGRQFLWPLSSYPLPEHGPPALHHKSLRPPSIFDSFRILRQASTALLIFSGTVITSGFMAILVSVPFSFASNYGFNPLQVGLCYLPYAAGGVTARWTVGLFADRNYRRHAAKAGVVVLRNRQTPEQMRVVPLERARLQFTLPFLYASAFLVTTFGWMVQERMHVAGPLVLLALLGNSITGVQNTLTMLLIDLHVERPATANAALTFFRSLASAGAVAATLPATGRIGVGWMATVIAGSWVTASLALWVVFVHGRRWREAKATEAI